MADPLQSVFGMSTPKLFRQNELSVCHGALERFPSFMLEGALSSVEALCRDYTGAVEIAQGTAEDGVQLGVTGAHPTGLLKAGLTVFFSDLKRSVPASSSWLREIEASLGLPQCASIMAFVNAPGSGLPLHHDRHEQLFFQIRGEKLFRYGPNRYVENPDLQFSPANAAMEDFGQRYQQGFPLTAREVLSGELTTVRLRPGSAFFMPGGTWHTTAEQEGESLSLVVAVRAPSRLELLLNLLRYYAGQSPAFRARSYGAWASDAGERALASRDWAGLLSELGRRLPGLPAQAAADAWCVHGIINGTQSDYPAHLRFERFIRLPNSSLTFGEVATDGKLSCVVLSGPNHRPQHRTVLAIHLEARVIVEWLLQQSRAFSLATVCEAFDDFEPEDVAELLSWLTRAALLRPLPAPGW